MLSYHQVCLSSCHLGPHALPDSYCMYFRRGNSMLCHCTCFAVARRTTVYLTKTRMQRPPSCEGTLINRTPEYEVQPFSLPRLGGCPRSFVEGMAVAGCSRASHAAVTTPSERLQGLLGYLRGEGWGGVAPKSYPPSYLPATAVWSLPSTTNANVQVILAPGGDSELGTSGQLCCLEIGILFEGNARVGGGATFSKIVQAESLLFVWISLKNASFTCRRRRAGAKTAATAGDE